MAKTSAELTTERLRNLEALEVAVWVPPDTVANINANYPAGIRGRLVIATDGRKTGEGVGLGTGVMCYDDGTNWVRVDDSTTVAA